MWGLALDSLPFSFSFSVLFLCVLVLRRKNIKKNQKTSFKKITKMVRKSYRAHNDYGEEGVWQTEVFQRGPGAEPR